MSARSRPLDLPPLNALRTFEAAARHASMTNAAVTKQVTKQEGNTLTLKHKDGEQTIVVPPDVIVVNLIPGENADLKPDAKIFIPAWAKKADGTWEAAVALVGRDGIIPPM